jgi:chromosome partitioning protein
MPVVLIANPKGGVGKSTIAANLAGFFARAGRRTMLGDLDPQQSVTSWLKLRSSNLPTIESWDVDERGVARPPNGTTHVVIDAPAGVKGRRLDAVLKVADRVIIPLQASMFDICATRDFLSALFENGLSRQRSQIGLLGVRIDTRTRAADQLARFVNSLGVPVLGHLRDTQNYVHLTAHGLTLWDVPPGRVEKDLEQWMPILKWVDGVASKAAPSRELARAA